MAEAIGGIMRTVGVRICCAVGLTALLAACGGATPEAEAPGDGTVASGSGLAASVSPSAAQSTNPAPSDASPSPSVAVKTGDVIAYSKSAEKAIKDLMGQGIGVSGGGGMCELGVGAVIESAGATVELSLPDGQKFVSRFVPSPINGQDLPCQIEAVFEDVPIPDEQSQVRFTSLGGPNVYTRQTAEIAGRKLIANGFTVQLD